MDMNNKYVEWLENKIEQCLEDKDLKREHWAFCQALATYRKMCVETDTSKREMKDYVFKTEKPLDSEEKVMNYFINERLFEVFNRGSIVTEIQGSYAEVLDQRGHKWSVQAWTDVGSQYRIKFNPIT